MGLDGREEYLAAEERRRTPEGENPVLQMIGLFTGDEGCRETSACAEEILREAEGAKARIRRPFPLRLEPRRPARF